MEHNAFEKMTYGVYVVASGNENKKNAFIATAVIQVTSEPLQIEVVCNKKNFTCQLMQESGYFSVSAIKKEYEPSFIGNFGFQSGATANKFEKYGCQYGKVTGVPIVVDNCIAWFECKLVQKMDVGSHIIFVGEVVDAKMLDANASPLTYAYYHEVKRGVAPANAPHGVPETTAEKITPMAGDNGPKYKCSVCGYVYDPALGDPDSGIAPGTPFEDLPDDWICPLCGVSKSNFVKID